MYQFLQRLLSDKKEGELFTLFSPWHFFYIGLAVIAIVGILLLMKNKKEETKKQICRFLSSFAFGLYVADFFLMPLAYGEIDIEKLPFHACTTMCVMCFLSDRVGFLKKYQMSFVKLGLVSNMVYLIYPAGVMWHAVQPLSYRVIQTLFFHCVMTVYGILMLAYHREKTSGKTIGRDFLVIVGMTVWALLGNCVYNGTAGTYSHFFNWFFVVRDPFYRLPEDIAPFVMPFINIALFFGVEMLLTAITALIARKGDKSKTDELAL